MIVSEAAIKRLAAIPNVTVLANAPLADHTRFRIGGPAAVLCDASDTDSFIECLRAVRTLALPRMVIGGGTNLVVADAGFDGVVLRYTGAQIAHDYSLLRVESGAILQDVVDRSMELGLKGLETLTGIPGYLGGAVYGNAGAYGHSIQELVERVWITDGEDMRPLSNQECQFHYRESLFKDRKEWVILSAELRFTNAEPNALRQVASEIRTIRDAKYPPSLRCAGSIYKNVFFADLPASAQAEVPSSLVRDGKVPSAWFLEQVGAKGMQRGEIHVASYHANLIYNAGAGTAADLVSVIDELKRRVRERFGFALEEEVQYVGFEYAPAHLCRK